ncbi:MAG: precorrin-3B C(17)-methyltransferase [Cyanobacteria bacterium J06638_22]
MILDDFQPLTAIAPTPFALKTLQPLWQAYPVTLWTPESLRSQVPAATAQVQGYQGSLKEQLPAWWQSRALVFCLATGAVVRLIAPLLQDKRQDPAVVVVDGTGQFVISLCGGHQGGADRLAEAIAALLHATPVLTGSANALQLPAIDNLGDPFGWRRGAGDWTAVSGAMAQGKSVRVVQTAGSTLWQAHLPEGHPFRFAAADTGTEDVPSAELRIEAQVQQSLQQPAIRPTVRWYPRVLWVGLGCERGTPQGMIAAAVEQVLAVGHLAKEAIAGIATIDLKADEVGILAFCDAHQLPLRCFPAEVLRSVEVPNPSEVVAAEVATPSVAEAAALLASDRQSLLVPKQIVRLDGQPGAVTVAIAQAEQETLGREGEIWLVGMGPGQLDQMTPAAKGAIAQADAVIGYSLYIDLIRPCLRPGQVVEALPITQERQRAERAIALAQWGLRVAVVSSGDCGIYGMAGLVFEQLREGGWNGEVPAVQVFPGITALQAAAARVGAPLMHDFCAISLSDLLTPWAQIETRLTAAAQADFVTALYNPRSRNRVEQLAIAQAIFLRYRDPKTSVAIVQSAYRPNEAITRTTLDALLEHSVDMLSLVLIGNRTTRFHYQWMITPRGYFGG